jgi:hypothetical protein
MRAARLVAVAGCLVVSSFCCGRILAQETQPGSELEKIIESPKPLQGYAAVDSKGTPRVPPWKIEEGEDAFVGKFYVGVVGVPLVAVDGPPPAAVLTGKQLAKWRGKKPFPCVIRFTKLLDDSGGYYFQAMGAKDGPQGWIIPKKQDIGAKKEKKSWSLYFRQEKKSD